MNLINSLFEVFKTLVYFIQFIIVFRNEIWAIRTSSLDNYFKTQKNCALFQKRIFSYGIIAIKICQWISQRIDILGYNTIKALEIFQKSIPYTPLTFHDKLLYKNFKYIDSHCIGSGSISQVHKAINNKGKHGVIKIKHNDVQINIYNNIGWITSIIPVINYFFPESSIFNLKQIICSIKLQLDYHSEVQNQLRLQNILSRLNFVIVPNIYMYSDSFIFQEMCCGLSRQEIQDQYPEYLIDMAQKTQAAYFWMAYCGYIHTDLHDGNVFYHIDIDDDSKNKIIILDFGLVFELEQKKEHSLHIKNFRFLSNKDNKGLISVIKSSLDHSFYSHTNLLNVYSKLDNIDFVQTNFKNINILEYSGEILTKLYETNAILRTPELYCFLGLILVCREFIDFDGKPFDVFLSSINLLQNSKDSEVQNYANELSIYISNLW
tara:strand:+ start:2544 stop:3845 length:1302 start_codon:yes stop_codon:yes gene_type:complete